AGGEPARLLRAAATLALELAFALGDDDLEPRFVTRQRLGEHLLHLADPVAVDGSQPLDAEPAQGAFDGALDARRAARARLAARLLGRRRDHLLRAGGRGVAVLHDDQHAVVAVEQARGHAREQAVVPEAPVAHHG